MQFLTRLNNEIKTTTHVRKVLDGDCIVVDYETDGLYTYRGHKPFTVVLTWCNDGYSEIIYEDQNPAFFHQRLKSIWENPKVIKVSHNAKFEIKMTMAMGIAVKGMVHCTMIQHQMLNNLAIKHSLDYAALQYAGVVPEWIAADKAVDKAKKIYGYRFDKIPRYVLNTYMWFDGERCALLHETQFPLLQKDTEMLKCYMREIAVMYVTIILESNGIMIHEKNLDKLIKWMQTELKQVDADAFKLLGKYVNLQSEKQLKHLLYTEMKLDPVYNKKKKISTDKDALEVLRKKYELPILDLILKKRAYTKGMAMLTAYKENAIDGILYPNINTNSAGTGRQSSSDPINFQNIQKEFSLRTRFAVPARSCFRPRPGHVFFLIDYQGIEMRLYVQGTKSKRLYDLVATNFDFHNACAINFYAERYTTIDGCFEFLFDKFADEIRTTKDHEALYKKLKKVLRSAAKNGRFAMAYGAGIITLADTLMLTIDDAREGKERDKLEYPEFYTFMDQCTYEAETKGHIVTFGGRKLQVPHDRLYAATDYKIQGSAAEVMKQGEIQVQDYLSQYWKNQIKLLLTIHDELIFEFPRHLLPQRNIILQDLRKNMIDIEGIDVNLDVEIKMTTTTWDKAKEVTFGL